MTDNTVTIDFAQLRILYQQLMATWWMRLVKVVLVLIVCVFFEQIYYHNYTADVHYESANRLIAEGDMPKALRESEQALSLNPLEPNYYRMRARVLINYLPKQPKEVQKQLKDAILKDLQQAYQLNPHNLVTIRNVIPLFYFISAQNISVGASPENVDPAYLPYARYFYEYHKDLFTNDVGVVALIAKYERHLNLMTEYNDSVERVKKLRPDLLEWYESFK